MQIQDCIANLLYQHQSVNLPGLGTIIARNQSSVIDHVQGKIAPPSKLLAFDPNLVLDDGLLTAEVARVFQISYSESAAKVSAFTESLKMTIAQGKIAGISGVGRLFKDVEGIIQFLPEEKNFDAESFGLPELQYHPVIRRTVAEPGAAPNQPFIPLQPIRESWWQRNILWLALVAIILLSASILWIQFYAPSKPGSKDTAEVPQEFLNVAPGESNEAQATPNAEGNLMEEEDSESPTMPPDQKICTIRIGKFGNADNVRRLVLKAQELGMNPYTKKDGGLTEVGITFPYSEEKEIHRMLSDTRKYLSPDAVIEKK
jgi:hypothetical protein